MSTIQITDFEQGTFDGSGHEASRNDRIRSTTRFQADTTAFSIKISAVSGKPLKLVLFGWDENNTFRDYLYWYNSGDTIYTSGKSVEYRIAMGYTDDTTISPEDITECSLTVGEWTMNNGTLVPPLSDSRPATAEYAMSLPYPKSYWRVDKNISPDMPWHELLSHARGLDLWSLPREHVIRVYDYHEPQDGFQHNGLAILRPSECISTHELNGRWDVTLTHPIDPQGRYKYLTPPNVLKIEGQLFRIDEHESTVDQSGAVIKVHAKHIFYDLADTLIMDLTLNSLNGFNFIYSLIHGQFHYGQPSGYDTYDFNYYSDIQDACGTVQMENTSVAGALIGTDNCFVNTFGGELYRNNFYFSINSRMEYAQDNAFALRYGFDMTKITQKIDYNEFCTFIVGRDNFGAGYDKAWAPGGLPIHHEKYRYFKFNYPYHDWNRFVHDVDALFGPLHVPKVSYEVNIASLRNDPKYKGFVDLQNYRLGDKGRIYCEMLDIDTEQQIVSVEKDELTGDILNIKLGNIGYSFVRPQYKANTISSGYSVSDRQMQAMQSEIDGINVKALKTWSGAKAYKWSETKKYKWGDIKNGN